MVTTHLGQNQGTHNHLTATVSNIKVSDKMATVKNKLQH
jgi:hypothetical protein